MTDDEKVVIADIKIAHCALRDALQRAADLGMSAELSVNYISSLGSDTKLLRASAHITRTRTITDIDVKF